jgi:undecaprenyl-diphosphatase
MSWMDTSRQPPPLERLNQAEARVLRQSPVLPARPPHTLVIWLTKLARGSKLWLLLAAVLAVHKGSSRRAALSAVQSITAATALNHLLIKRVIHRRRPHAEHIAAHNALGTPPTSGVCLSCCALTA